MGDLVQQPSSFAETLEPIVHPDMKVMIQGLEIDIKTPISWIHQHLLSVDGWINVVLLPSV